MCFRGTFWALCAFLRPEEASAVPRFLARAHSEHLFVHSVKMGIAVEARVDAGLQQGLAVLVQGTGQEKPFIIQILIDGHSGDGAEDPAQMIFIEKKGIREPVQSDPLRQVLVQPQQNILDPLILHDGLGQRHADLIELVKKFQEHAFGDQQGALLQIAVDLEKECNQLPFLFLLIFL